MVRTNRNQRLAIKRIFDRGPIYKTVDAEHHRVSYREFRKTVMATFGMNNAVVVPWAGMYVAIERDGYANT